MAKENDSKVGPDIKTFRQEVNEKLKDAQALDEVNRKKQSDLEKQIAALEQKLVGERALLEKMKADYLSLADNRTAAAEREEMSELKLLTEKLKSGGVDVSAFQAGKAKLRQEREGKLAALKRELADSLEVIRTKDREVMELERDLLNRKLDFYYLESVAPELGIRDIEKLLKSLSARRQISAAGCLRVQQRLERVKDFLDRATGKNGLSGLTSGERFDSLDLAGVRVLRFRASIPVQYLPLLEKAVDEIAAHDAQRKERGQCPGIYRVTVEYSRSTGGAGRVEWMCENPNSPQVVVMGLQGRGREVEPGTGRVVDMHSMGKQEPSPDPKAKPFIKF